MADQIEIVNVGGEGVASEVTLARLLGQMEKLAKSEGLDPKKVNKKLNDFAKSIDEGIDVVDDNRKAFENVNDELKETSRRLNNLGRGALGLFASGIGAAIESVLGLTQEILGAEKSLTSFARHIPIVGNSLTIFTGIMDDSFEAFQSMATSGATFGYSLGDLRVSARELRLDFNELSSFVTQNSERLAAFGGTVDGGIRATRQLSEALGSEGREALIELGLSAEEVSEQLSFFQYVNRAGARARIRDERASAEAASMLTKNMLTLSKLTGEDISQKRDAMAQAQMDMAFQMEMARLTPEQQAAMQESMSIAMSEGGTVAVNALKAEFLNMPAITDELRVYTATQAEGAAIVRGMVRDVRNITSERDLTEFMNRSSEYMADYFEATIRSAQMNEGVLRAGAAGLDGIAATMAEQYGVSAQRMASYMTADTNGTIRFARERFIEDMEEARLTNDGDDDELDTLASFREALGEARESITTNLTNPLLVAVQPALNTLATEFQSFVGEDGENTLFQNAVGLMREKIEAITPKIISFMNAFAADPENAIRDVFRKIGNSISDWFLGPINDEMGMSRSGGFLENTIQPIFAQLGQTLVDSTIDGVKALWENTTIIESMVLGIGALWGSQALASAFAARAAASVMSGGGSGVPPATPGTGAGANSSARGGGFWRRASRFARGVPYLGTALGGAFGIADNEYKQSNYGIVDRAALGIAEGGLDLFDMGQNLLGAGINGLFGSDFRTDYDASGQFRDWVNSEEGRSWLQFGNNNNNEVDTTPNLEYNETIRNQLSTQEGMLEFLERQNQIMESNSATADAHQRELLAITKEMAEVLKRQQETAEDGVRATRRLNGNLLSGGVGD